MNPKGWGDKLSIENKGLYYKLFVIFGLFFIAPVMGFLYFAVMNKSPLLVEDIETDSRFGRQSRPHYATKSFICMPPKTINDVIGVLTVSRRKSEAVFRQSDVDALTPLLSNAAFTYDNLRLLQESDALWKIMRSLGVISQAINSSLRDGELLQTLFQEIRKNIPCDMIAILTWDRQKPRHLYVADFLAFIPTTLNRGDSYPCEGTVFDTIIKQQRTTFIDNVKKFSQPTEKNCLFKTAPRRVS